MHVRSDDALTCLLELPPPFRITVLALMGEPDPISFEQTRTDRYIDTVTRYAEQGRIDDLMAQIEAVEAQRRAARHLQT